MSWNIKTPGDFINGPLTVAGNVTLTGGTANGIPYLNASKVVTTSDKLSFANTPGYFDSTLNINSLLGSALYRGGITITEDEVAFTLFGGSGYKLIQTSGFSTPNQLRFYASNVEQYRIGASGVFNWYDGAGGTRMTLNSTGLGVGVSPAVKLDIGGAATQQFRIQMSGQADTRVISDTGAGIIGTYSNHQLIIRTNSTNAVFVDASQNVGIGVTPSAWTTSYNALNIGSGVSIAAYKSANYDQLTFGCNHFENTSGAWRFINNGYATQYWHNSGSHVWRISTISNAAGANQPLTWTQAMTLDASGRLLVGSTSNPAYDGFRTFFYNNGNNTLISQCDSANYCLLLYTGNGTNTGSAAAFKYGATTVGTIQTTASSTAYNTSSDYRLKELVQPMTGALNRIAALKPSTYKWKVDGSAGEGFIAHELAQVVPLAVTGEKDAVNEDGSIKAQGVDLSKVVPVLVAAIQELAAEVNALKNA